MQFFRRLPVKLSMEKRRFLWAVLLFLCVILPTRAQWDVSYSHYWATRSYTNPSFAGEKEAIRATALYRYPWSGIEQAPQYFLIAADMPFEFLGRRHGVGVAAHTERVGSLRNSLLTAQYSFKKEIGDGFLNVGLQAGVHDLKFNAGNRQFVADSLSLSHGKFQVASTDKKLFDLGAGISWTSPSLFIGFSNLHINHPRFPVLNPEILSENPDAPPLLPIEPTDSLRSSVPRSYNFMAGYNIRLFRSLELQPMVWLQNSSDDTRAQATLRFVYDKKFSGGASWRKDHGWVLFAGTTLKGVEWGYAYDLYTKGFGKSSKGSHEMYLRYEFPVDYFKPKRQPHKSIRLL